MVDMRAFKSVGPQKAVDLSTPGQRKEQVQRVWVGFYSRWQDPAAIEIQKHWRAYAARKLVTALRGGHLLLKVPCSHAFLQESAARVIQRHWRGFLGRQQAKERLGAVVRIQSCWKGYLARRVFPAMRRRWRYRNEAATEIQRRVRGFLVRARQHHRACSRLLLGFWQQLPSRHSQATLRHYAAAVIQRTFRGWACCKQLRTMRGEAAAAAQQRASAASVIQRAWRRHHTHHPPLRPSTPLALDTSLHSVHPPMSTTTAAGSTLTCHPDSTRPTAHPDSQTAPQPELPDKTLQATSSSSRSGKLNCLQAPRQLSPVQHTPRKPPTMLSSMAVAEGASPSPKQLSPLPHQPQRGFLSRSLSVPQPAHAQHGTQPLARAQSSMADIRVLAPRPTAPAGRAAAGPRALQDVAGLRQAPGALPPAAVKAPSMPRPLQPLDVRHTPRPPPASSPGKPFVPKPLNIANPKMQANTTATGQKGRASDAVEPTSLRAPPPESQAPRLPDMLSSVELAKGERTEGLERVTPLLHAQALSNSRSGATLKANIAGRRRGNPTWQERNL